VESLAAKTAKSIKPTFRNYKAKYVNIFAYIISYLAVTTIENLPRKPRREIVRKQKRKKRSLKESIKL
jgi:hypothetical protein